MKVYTAATYKHFHEDNDFGAITIIGPFTTLSRLTEELFRHMLRNNMVSKVYCENEEKDSDEIFQHMVDYTLDLYDLQKRVEKHLYSCGEFWHIVKITESNLY